MRNKIFLACGIMLTWYAKAQVVPEIQSGLTINEFKLAEATKSGNYKDVLAGFFQLAAKNFTGNEKTIGFNTTLFGLKVMGDSDLFKDLRLRKETFSRNFQLGFNINLNDDYDYSGFTAGLTYAVINGRDAALADFTGSELHLRYFELTDAMVPIRAKLDAKGISTIQINEAVNAILNNKTADVQDQAIINQIYAELDKAPLLKNFPADPQNPVKDSKMLMAYLHTLREKYYNTIAKKALWTFTVDATSNDVGKFRKASVGSIFLKGSNDYEIDLRAKFTYSDTLLATQLQRRALKSSAGVNFAILKSVSGENMAEFKAYGEYSKVFKDPLPDEEEEGFFANADIRIRIGDDLWLPFTLKYDIENANFLGFLNITYNFDSL